jgi:hypothetical protein
MTRLLIPVLLLGLMATAAHASETERIHLKNGTVLDARVVSVNEDGLKVDLDGMELFIRWTFTRGDRHLDMRKEATDYRDIASLMRLADFCHEFALDEEEYRTLAFVLRIDSSHYEARERIRQLPSVEGVTYPGKGSADPAEPDDPVDPAEPAEPEPQEPEPQEPEDAPLRVFVGSDDAEAATWLRDELGRLDFEVVSESAEYDVRIVLDVELELIENPRFMGADVYAVYKGEMRYRMFRRGESDSTVARTVKVDRLRRDSREEARTACRRSLLEDASPAVVSTLQDIRRQMESSGR